MNNKLLSLTVVLFLLGSVFAFAQDEPQFPMGNQETYSITPPDDMQAQQPQFQQQQGEAQQQGAALPKVALPDMALPAQETIEQPKENEPIDKNKLTLDIKGMDVIDVLQMLARRSGMNIVIGKNVTGRVTLFLKNVDVNDAFEIVLLSNDLASEKKGEIVNVITQQEYELKYGTRYKDKKQVRIIQLKYAKASELALSLNQIKSNNGRIVVNEGSNTFALIDVPDKLEELENFIKRTDLPLQTKVFNLNYATVEKLNEKIQKTLTKEVGVLQIDERTNKIVVTDYPEKLKQVEKMIAAFDEKTPQVLIDAQIVEINPKKDQFSMGVDWDFWLNKNLRLAGSMAAPTLTDVSVIPNKLSLGTATAGAAVSAQGQQKSIIDMLRVIGETKILSSPRIMALNNQEAKILVGTKEAYITSATSQSSETAVTSQTVNFVDVGIKLYVTPTINREGFVTMKIKPEISSSKRTDITSDGKVTQIPIVTTSESETTIMVKDGTTIVIAGLKKDQRNKEIKKIPGLGDIPFLGVLFRNVKDEVIKTELVIFLTPHIVTGEETFSYTSLTGDKDIIALQNTGKLAPEEKSVKEARKEKEAEKAEERNKQAEIKKQKKVKVESKPKIEKKKIKVEKKENRQDVVEEALSGAEK